MMNCVQTCAFNGFNPRPYVKEASANDLAKMAGAAEAAWAAELVSVRARLALEEEAGPCTFFFSALFLFPA